MTKHYLLSLLAAASLAASASAPTPTTHTTGAIFIPSKPSPCFNSKALEIPENTPVSRGETGKLTLSVSSEDPKYNLDYITFKIYGENYRTVLFSDPDNTKICVDLPKGDYIVFAEIEIRDQTAMFSRGGFAWIVKEVTVNDNTSVTIDPAEATVDIVCRSVNPDGEEPMLPTQKYTAAGVEELEGNITVLDIISTIVHSKFGEIYGRESKGNFGVIDETGGTSFDIQRITDIHINPLSDNYTIYQKRMMSTASDGFYFTAMRPITGATQSVEGKFETEYPISHTITYQSNSQTLSPDEVTKPYMVNSSRYSLISAGNRIQIAGLDNAFDNRRFMTCVADYAVKQYDDEGELMGTMAYYSPLQAVTFDSEGKPTIEVIQLNSEYTTTDNWEDEYAPVEGHPAFSFTEADTDHKNGDSQPSILFLSQRKYDWDTEELVWYCDPLPVGRRGEVRISDIPRMKTEQLHPDDETFTYNAVLDNTIVDGIEGQTTASFTLKPETDICAPVVQMLQFRNTSGRVTDRFANAADGLLRIAAGDFNQKTDDPETYSWSWFEVSPAEMAVEYSPLGADKWLELPVTERPEWFIREFGHTYEGSLANVYAPDYKGWFDLRITLADSNGSTSTQTISPAFRIDRESGIAAAGQVGSGLYIKDDTAVSASGKMIEVMTIDGSTVARGLGSVSLSTLPYGIYIITDGTNTIKTAR